MIAFLENDPCDLRHLLIFQFLTPCLSCYPWPCINLARCLLNSWLPSRQRLWPSDLLYGSGLTLDTQAVDCSHAGPSPSLLFTCTSISHSSPYPAKFWELLDLCVGLNQPDPKYKTPRNKLVVIFAMIMSPNSTVQPVCTKLDMWNANFPNKYNRRYLNFLQKNLKHQKVRFGRDINNTLVQSISQSTFKERQRGIYVHKLLSERVLCSSEDTAYESPLTGIKNICQQIKDLENPPPVNPLEF